VEDRVAVAVVRLEGRGGNGDRHLVRLNDLELHILAQGHLAVLVELQLAAGGDLPLELARGVALFDISAVDAHSLGLSLFLCLLGRLRSLVLRLAGAAAHGEVDGANGDRQHEQDHYDGH